MLPEDAKYTAEHEWVRSDGDDLQVGITDFAQEALGDIVYVSLPEVGLEVQPGQAIGEIESTKSVSDLYAPVAGVVSARNEALDAQPELVNSDPYGEGWMLKITPSSASALDGLLDAAGYQGIIAAG